MKNSNQHGERCEAALEALTSLMENGDITEIQLVELKMRFPDCIEIIQEQYSLWQDLTEVDIPEVSKQLHSNFYATLAALESKNVVPKIPTLASSDSNTKTLWNSPWKWAIAASILALGIMIGRGFDRSSTQLYTEDSHSPISHLSYVNQSHPVSATEKLLAIQEIREESHPSDKIIEALYQVLLNDNSINVRLTTIETLIHFADQPKAREYLIRAIPFQESALVQVALADAMLILQEKKSVDAWKDLLESPNVEPDVKMHITETIETLL